MRVPFVPCLNPPNAVLLPVHLDWSGRGRGSQCVHVQLGDDGVRQGRAVGGGGGGVQAYAQARGRPRRGAWLNRCLYSCCWWS